MDKPVFISRTAKLATSLDYELLRKLALKFSQKFSGALWTDYNDHDPGVTILEYLCFAITDVAYRADFPIEDIIYAESDQDSPERQALYPDFKILPAHPQTVTDYRKIIIDQIPEVKNAWIHPVENGIYSGLYRIQLQLAKEKDIPTHYLIAEKVKKAYLAHRNLCEDLDTIEIMEHLPITVRAKINLEIDALGEAVVARIFARLESFFTPRIPTYLRSEIEAELDDVNQIFDGPLPEFGFIKDQELSPLRSVMYVSRLREVLDAVEGVQAVESIHVFVRGIEIETDEIAIPPKAYPVLSEEMWVSNNGKSPISLARSGIGIYFDPGQVKQQYDVLTARSQRIFNAKMELSAPTPHSRKKMADLTAYHSLQRLFPAVYGIGEAGLPIDATQERKAQAKQLKAYLSIFEQFLASYLSQLGEIRSLFSIAEDVVNKPTYSGQLPTDIPDLNSILRRRDKVGDPKTIKLPGTLTNEEEKESIDDFYAKAYKELIEAFDQSERRRNRFLDHLLARVGEVFYADTLRQIWVGEGLPEEDVNKALLNAKASFLRAYPNLSKDRGKAFNYRQPSWITNSQDENIANKTQNTSGLEQRIKHYLSLPEKGVRSITDFNLNKFQALSDFVLKEEPVKRKGKDKFRARLSLKKLMRNGMDRKNYRIEKNKEGYYTANFYRSANAKPELLFAHEKKVRCNQVITQLIAWLKTFNESSNGFFLLEHVLLRPMTQAGRKLIFDVSPTGVSVKFNSLMYLPGEQMRHISDGLIISATDEDNYARFKRGEDTYLLLKIDGHPMLVSQDPLSDELLNQKPEQKIIDYLNTIKVGGSSQIDEWIELPSQPNYAKKMSGKFFDHRLSIVVPDWPRKWQLVDFRKYFRVLIQANIPAHIAADIHFLSIDEMRAFEATYQSWLEEKRRENPSPNQLDTYSLSLIEFLLKNQDDKAKIGSFLADQEKENKINEELRAAVVGAVGFDIIDEGNFGIFVGINEVIEAELKKNGIDNWVKLQIAKASYLANILTIANISEITKNIKSWQRQAILAEQGNWQGLIALQIELEALTTKDAQPKLVRYMKEKFGNVPEF